MGFASFRAVKSNMCGRWLKENIQGYRVNFIPFASVKEPIRFRKLSRVVVWCVVFARYCNRCERRRISSSDRALIQRQRSVMPSIG